MKRQWLCPPQGRATYTADPVLRVQDCCCCCGLCWPWWSGVTWVGWLSRGSSTSVGMRDWNFSSCSGLARFFRRLFSLSSWLFFSASSLICSLRISTSSRTAYIRWFLTRSCHGEKKENRVDLDKLRAAQGIPFSRGCAEGDFSIR